MHNILYNILKIHNPFAIKKGAVILKLSSDDMIGYDPAMIATAWEVCYIMC